MTPEYLLKLNLHVVIQPLGSGINGDSVRVGDRNLVMISDTLSETARWKAFLHELVHIRRDDFNRDEAIEIIEND